MRSQPISLASWSDRVRDDDGKESLDENALEKQRDDKTKGLHIQSPFRRGSAGRPRREGSLKMKRL
eukprot:8607830-Heterocapsa_arctica.AAC.1